MSYIQRTLESVLNRAVREFPAVVLTGPRQSGKTTLLKHLFAPTHRYVSLETPDVQASALEDPRGFLELYPPPVIIDEIQSSPALLPYLKERIDSQRHKTGQFLLTGSQNLLLNQSFSETLAGRTAILRLLPLSYREIMRCPDQPLPWEKNGGKPSGPRPAYVDLWRSFLRGGYPELIAKPARDSALWQGSYIQTYLERDVRALRHVGGLSQFQDFLRALAARNAQLLSLSYLARDLGVAVNTIKAWLSVLEATYQIILLRPFYRNIGKRLVKSPKVYFTDTGLLCYLCRLRDPKHAMAGPMAGAIMETAVVIEVLRALTHRGHDPALYFWRTTSGNEVDLVIESDGGLVPIEIKTSATPNPGMAKGIQAFWEDQGKTCKGYVVHPGDIKLPLASDIVALPFGDL